MKVKVIQFMRPNGRQVEQSIEINDKCKENYDKIIKLGGRLTAEQLMTGVVSQTIENEFEDFDITLSEGSNFKENVIKMEEMIMRFDADEYIKRLKQYQEV